MLFWGFEKRNEKDSVYAKSKYVLFHAEDDAQWKQSFPVQSWGVTGSGLGNKLGHGPFTSLSQG